MSTSREAITQLAYMIGPPTHFAVFKNVAAADPYIFTQ